MPFDLHIGSSIPIPCRHCGKQLIPLLARTGTHPVTCGACNDITYARIEFEGGAIRVYTSTNPQTRIREITQQEGRSL